MEPSDESLTRQAALGDRQAFSVLVRRHGPALFRYALPMLDGNVHDAEDAVQSALASAWANLPRFRSDSSLRTWLFRITANEVLSARRRRRPTPVDNQLLEPLPAPRHDQPAAQLDYDRLARDLTAALGELPWRQRACWLLTEVEGMSYQQIAEALETNTTVVRGQLHRARSTLAVRMAQWR